MAAPCKVGDPLEGAGSAACFSVSLVNSFSFPVDNAFDVSAALNVPP